MNFVNNDEGYVLGGRELIRTMEEIHGYFRIHRANDFRGDIKRFGFFRNLNPKLQDEVSHGVAISYMLGCIQNFQELDKKISHFL
jgi:hypothetical protein